MQQQKISIMKEFKFAPGDYLLSKRFGWQYKIISIRNGVAVLQDIVRENVRVRFTLRPCTIELKLIALLTHRIRFSIGFGLLISIRFFAVQTSSLI